MAVILRTSCAPNTQALYVKMQAQSLDLYHETSANCHMYSSTPLIRLLDLLPEPIVQLSRTSDTVCLFLKASHLVRFLLQSHVRSHIFRLLTFAC